MFLKLKEMKPFYVNVTRVANVLDLTRKIHQNVSVASQWNELTLKVLEFISVIVGDLVHVIQSQQNLVNASVEWTWKKLNNNVFQWDGKKREAGPN